MCRILRLAGMLLLVLPWVACEEPEPKVVRSPIVVIGVDGGSWNAIRDLWSQGRLPHLRELAARGVSAELKPVANASPVIWTSMVTGVTPSRHGITNFVVPTAGGDVPVSSVARKVPAIWNMVSAAQRRVAVIGWWASWPAEQVNGVVISDRADQNLEGAIYPPELAATLRVLIDQPLREDAPGFISRIARQDRAFAAVARHLVTQGFDLLLVYLRNVDVESHRYWKYFKPDRFEQIDEAEIERHGERIPLAYEAVDRAVGELVAAAPPEATIIVVSDHGFHALTRSDYRYLLDLDTVLEHLGFLSRRGGEIDWQRTEALAWDSPTYTHTKLIRYALSEREPSGPVKESEIGRLRGRLEAALGAVTYEDGSPSFHLHEPSVSEQERGGDLAVFVRQRGRSSKLYFQGQVIPGAVDAMYEISGTHSAATEGIFLAAGPAINPNSGLTRIHTLDITPTLLYAMGLPVAADFDGQARTELFDDRFRRQHPLQTIATWGTQDPGVPPASEVDEELLGELRALGYLD